MSCGRKATAARPRRGQGMVAPGGVLDRGAHEEDGPVNWESHTSPSGKFPVGRRTGDQSPTGRRPRMPASPGEEQASVLEGRPRARGTGAWAEGGGAVGGLRTSGDLGEPLAQGPGRAKAGRVITNLSERNMKRARTQKDMSPKLRRVAERARRDPQERQFSLA